MLGMRAGTNVVLYVKCVSYSYSILKKFRMSTSFGTYKCLPSVLMEMCFAVLELLYAIT